MKSFLNKCVQGAVIVSAAVLIGVGISEDVEAEQVDNEVVDEAWGKANYVYGGGLTQSEILETAEALGINELEDVENYPVSGEDLQTYLGYGAGNSSSMISSALVQRESEGSGVEVTIETPRNITEITEEQYMNAAITAGVEDATIQVGSVRPVTGESALTAVYKAFETNGEEFKQDRMNVAQEELETTSNISSGLNEDESMRLNQAMIEIKQELAKLKENQEGSVNIEDIQVTIINVIEDNELDTVITEENITQLMNFFEKYQETDAIDSEAVKEQLNNLSSDLQERFGGAWQRAEESGFIDRIASFIGELWNTLIELFN